MEQSPTNKRFVPLHVKSEYSLGYGTASVDDLVAQAADLGYRSLGLTDLENLYAQVRFHHQCRLHGIRPITGVELRPGFTGRENPGRREGRLVLLALDRDGYRSLCRIVSCRRGGAQDVSVPFCTRGESGGGEDPVPFAEKYPDGLLALSDDPTVTERLLSGGNFPSDRLGLLVVRPQEGANDWAKAVEAAQRLGIRLVADLDAVFLRREDHQLHLLQLAISKARRFEEMADDPVAEAAERWLRNPVEAAALFAGLPEALAGAEAFAEACRLELGSEEGAPHIFNPEAERDEGRRLRLLCDNALAEKSQAEEGRAKEYRRRLDEELSVLDNLSFSGFMLIVADILSHCREEGILVAARGSAVSSLVLHLLGGSPVDPLAHGLLFERFLHVGKTAWPDVDLDIPWDRRDEVIAWVYERFGQDKVAMVAAHHTFRYRSALREGLKAWGAPESVIESMSRAIPAEDLAVEEIDFLDLARSLPREGPSDEVIPVRHPMPSLNRILPLIKRLVGRPRHVAVHPGGIVIDWRPLRDLLPLERASKGVVITQYDLVSVAKLGLVKIDLLGNRCLSEIEETLAAAGWQKPLRLEGIPAEDPDTLDMIDRAQTIGCFQLESPAMRSLVARLPIRRQSDLIAALALIRPGAASGEVKNSFVRRARGEEKREIPFPVLADRLRETHGLPIYEEDIMLLLSRTGGVSLAEADELRRGIVKSGGDPALLSSVQARFLGSAQARFLGDKAALTRARRAWGTAARFAAYSFNKAHAASYALLSYDTAYLKAHHPLQFACALLNHHQGLYPLRIEAAEFLRMGVKLFPPHVNSSLYHSVSENLQGHNGVRVGLDKVKILSRKAALQIISERENGGSYSDLGDLLKRVRLGVHEVTALVLCGACDGLPPLNGEDYPFIHEAVVERLRKKSDPAELERLRVTVADTENAAKKEQTRLYKSLVRVRNELTYLEMHLSAHPMALLRKEAARNGAVEIARLAATPAGSSVVIAAVVGAMRRVVTRQGPMQFITFDDETGLLEAVVFPAVYRQLGERVTTPGPFLAEGKLRVQQDALHLEVTRLKPFHQREKAYQG